MLLLTGNMDLDKSYMYNNKWTRLCEESYRADQQMKSEPYVTEVENGIILPQRNGMPTWGLGGCIREDGTFVEESRVNIAFGGIYEINSNPEFVDDDVIYIPIIPNHWGHFIVDVISRLWIIFDSRYYRNGMKIYFCGWRWPENILSGKCKDFFTLCGIEEDQLVFVDKPIRIRKILIPTHSMSFSSEYHEFHKIPVEHVVRQVISDPKFDGIVSYEKIYFSRTKLPASGNKEIGEKHIENVFRKNGFHVLYPEELSLSEQIYYINQADVYAGVSGTTMHNLIFGKAGLKAIILNRTPIPCPPQILINKLYNSIQSIFVDAYLNITAKHPADYGLGPFWIGINDNFCRFCDDNNIKYDENIKKSVDELFRYIVMFVYYHAVKNKLTIWIYRYLQSLRTKK